MHYNPRYPLKHISIRVPWHDNGWNGSICKDPKSNGSCLVLTSCSLNRDDNREQLLAGRSIKDLSEHQFPACIGERGTFMAPFSINKTLNHPYAKSSHDTHGHLKPTRLHLLPFSAAAIPYNWMLTKSAKEKVALYDLNFNKDYEPKLSWVKTPENTWLQEFNNQKALLNCFFEHFKEGYSLAFFYAKQVPFVEASGRVLIGVGRVNKIIPSAEYDGSNNHFSAAYWEHMIVHSIRNDHRNGFLLPYHAAIDYQKKNPDIDIAELAVMTPADKQIEFSYAAEHVSSDSAIRIMLECIKSLEKCQRLKIGENHDQTIKWIHDEIAKLEKLRGAYPGMGSALCAFGIEKGHFVAAKLINHLTDDTINPWTLFEHEVDNLESVLSKEIAALIQPSAKKIYKQLKANRENRIHFLHLLSRFDISIDQAKTLFVEEEREKLKIIRKEDDYLINPYLIYEDLLLSINPIALSTIDLGLYIKNPPDDLVPNQLAYSDPFDSYRVRALTIQQLELSAGLGHTLMPRKQIINQIRELAITPKCEINSDYYELAETTFGDTIELAEMHDSARAYQLQRFKKTKDTINRVVKDRFNAPQLEIIADWESLLNQTLKVSESDNPDEQEIKARQEKAAALKEIAESRISVLIGPAGTGKTTLLSTLARHKEVEQKGVLLLAPTGKARVRMEEQTKDLKLTARTIAQFLTEYGRFDGLKQRYIFSEQFCKGLYETVILDEASMLTEEMLATTLHCLRGVKRLILVGDHRQLPPIGAGRPFIDIIKHLKPDGIEAFFPRIGKGYCELTVKRRHKGLSRDDLQLAEWFSGEPLEPGADAIINQILINPDSDYLRMEFWENEIDFSTLFEKVLRDELDLNSNEDLAGFNKSLGAEDDGKSFKFEEAVKKVEAWQILSPIREKVFGVKAINRKIHKLFREERVKYAKDKKKDKMPEPIGIEEIVVGDKVINLSNTHKYPSNVYPKNALNYIANGEIGIVIGQIKKPEMTFEGKPQRVEVEFTSQKGFKYWNWEFDDERGNSLELAYALTVHKSQGSEFGKVFLIIPNPCFLLTREMLYTALTRQKDKVIILYQGKSLDIKALSSPLKSDSLKRITNLFIKPELIEIDGHYLEKNLIHQASDKTMLRSKSELLIYQRLVDKGLIPIYEKKLVLKEVEKLPDFTIENEETGETYYWEHCGMLFDKGYRDRWEEKYKWYRENDILPFEESGGKNGTLIITEDKPYEVADGSIRGGFSTPEVDEIIRLIFNR